jgi:hypothetical protein
MRRPSRERETVCLCGQSFRTRHSQGKYCSPACARQGARASWRRYAELNRPARRAYHRGHYQANRDRVLARTSAYQRSPAGRRAQQANGERQRAKFPERYAARQAVLVAVRAGRLKSEACARCGDLRTQAHHGDYSKPLEVVWLCRACHDFQGGRSAMKEAS